MFYTVHGKSSTTSDFLIFYSSLVCVKYHYTFCTESQLELLFFLLHINKNFQRT